MDLNQLAQEMRQEALDNKLDVRNNKGLPLPRRVVQVGGLLIRFQFSYDVLSEGKALWHLSFSAEGHELIPDQLVQEIKKVFFGDAEILRLDSIWGDKCHQYLSWAAEGR